VYVLRDRRQPLFRCFILVGPGQGRVITAAPDGSFRFPNITDGDYTVRVYYEGRLLSEAPAHVANNHDVVIPPLNLAAPPPAPAGAGGAPAPAGAGGAPAPAGAGGAQAPAGAGGAQAPGPGGAPAAPAAGGGHHHGRGH
jgi:hypothetical protein